MTWDDLMSACETLLNNGVQPFEIGEMDNYRFGHLHTVLNYKTYGTDVAYELGDRSMSYDSQEQLDIYQMIIDAYEAGYLGTNLLGTDDAQEQEYFNSGEVPFYFIGSWYCANAGTGDNELFNQQKIHTIPFPYVNEEYASHNMGGANEALYVVDTGDEDELAASVLFLKYMINVDKLNKSFPNRRTIENSDLCANTPKKYSFSGKLAINRSITPLLRLELSSREAFEGRSSLKNKP